MTDLIRRLRQHDGHLGLLVEEAADALEAALAATPAETLERIAELQYEAGMYECLYENSQKRLAFLIGDADLTHYEADAESVLAASQPPVGGEAQAPHGNFTERAIKLITDAAGHRDDWGKYEYAIIDLAREADASQQPAPLRGREELKRAFEGGFWAWFGPSNNRELDKGLCELERCWTEYEAEFLSAAPPEQLATNDLTEIMELAGDDRVSSEALGIRLRALWTSNR